MTIKPPEITKKTIYTHWDSDEGMVCPICGRLLRHEFNDGGRELKTLKGPIWVITNYYSCGNQECRLHKAFPVTHSSCISRKRHSVEVWAKVVQHHFKYHMNYKQVAELIWDDWKLSISEGTVRNICQYFEMAGLQHKNTEVRQEVIDNGRIFLSLDGAQPIVGEPALWVFSDRLTGNVLVARLLESAPAPVLKKIYAEIEEKFDVPIVAVISDKQRNIVNSVREFRPDIPHAYCQYHFLNHIAEPISAKDSHLRRTLHKKVRALSLMQNEPLDSEVKILTEKSPVSEIFHPIVHELKCAISARGNHLKTFAGREVYQNIEYIIVRLEECQTEELTNKIRHSLTSLINSLKRFLESTRSLYEEVCLLIRDFEWLRVIFSNRDWSGAKIESWVVKWFSVLHKRLIIHGMEHNAQKLKWKYPSYKMSLTEAWQQWIRLEGSYKCGLYCAYDDPDLELTNNPKEQLFHHSKAHFRAMLGRQNIARAYQSKGGLYAHLKDFDYSKEHVSSVLLASETPLTEANRWIHNAQYTVSRRRWRIREFETGNFKIFMENLEKIRKNIE